MKPAIPTGLTPPRPGLEREEPELAHEDDIPADDGTAMPPEDEASAKGEERPLRQVERE
jgi:hypothetical protein